ncbi:MAG: triose-phosphate isomerase [Planctomycetota bacterium]
MTKPFVAGNWKMNMDLAGSRTLAAELAQNLEGTAGEKVDVALCPPFVYLDAVRAALDGSWISVGAQDVYFENNGAFTGEISCAMLRDIGCSYVIIGHSERRHVLGETDDFINRKIKAAIEGGLLVIFCVGELLQQREAGKTETIVTKQINTGLQGINAEQVQAVTVAYEPVWAIGTGRNATPKQAREVHRIIRGLLAAKYSRDIASKIRIQYGGSVKPDNARQIMEQDDVDGLLVGGASLKTNDFTAIINAAT